MKVTHGAIAGVLSTVPDLDAALADYHGRLGLTLLEQGTIDADLAASWGCPASAGARIATLQPGSGAPCFLRLIEQPIPPGVVPTTTFGWSAFELTVTDVFGWPARLEGSGFEVVGPPKDIPGLPWFIAMQVHGTGGEMLYLNETRANTPSNDLPKAVSPVDHAFIVILAAPDRAAAVAWYCNALGLDEGETHVIPYTMINRAFALPAETLHGLTMVSKGRLPIVEVDDFPAQATPRPTAPGCLPPGNSLVTLAVESLDACDCTWIAPPVVRDGPLYAGRRVATTSGPAGELLELVEIG